MKSSRTTLFFPKIPSILELEILNIAGYCTLCDMYGNHNIKPCIFCDKIICYDYDDDIWILEKTGKEICQQCRYEVIKGNKPFTFVSIRKYNTLKISKK